jgi:hypothetical protein
MTKAILDHLVISAETLDQGVAWVESVLGVQMAGGGEHPTMGTHNRLLSLGPDAYIEVIAINPAAGPPQHPRLFDMDHFRGEPKLTNWVLRTKSISAALTLAPQNAGRATLLGRDSFRWLMAVPADGRYPYGGAFPGLIEWHSQHPAPLLPDAGCRLTGFEITHPEAGALQTALAPFLDDMRVSVRRGAKVGFRAQIATPQGPRVLA